MYNFQPKSLILRCVRTLWFLTICIAMVDCQDTSAQVVVVVNKANPIEDISLQKLRDIYTGSTVVWNNHLRIYPASLKSNRTTTKSFYRTAFNKKPADMKRVWIKLMLSGESPAPKILSSEDDVLEYVVENAGAIGFVHIDNVTEHVRILSVEGKNAEAPNYPLHQE